ncbi:MAG: methyltransferase type 11 [Nanoarchaeota archaeon]|nr:methyltransferase type 11 [Nanoarchaeota archaeon]|tara:strand:- start:2183 stop:2854 length:672 start_codon:yes stop_codon:yes gene_type:complete
MVSVKTIQNKFDGKVRIYSPNLNPYMIRAVPDNKKVLDVGCSSGTLGKHLKEHKNCRVWGLDISQKAVDEAKETYEDAAVMDLDRDEFPFKNEKFDVIVFADVLEHVVEPREVLNRFKEYLENDGIIVISIPNVATIAMRLHLLFGNWNYTQLGTLDNTHLRFFTRKTMKNMIENVGLEIIENGGGHPVVIKKLKIMPVYNLLQKIYPNLFSSQFVMISKLKN